MLGSLAICLRAYQKIQWRNACSICVKLKDTKRTLELRHERFLSLNRQEFSGNILSKLKKKVHNVMSDTTKTKIGAALAYENIADGVDWNKFLKHLELEDTFQSYFSAITMHVWMCALVAVPGKSGRIFRNNLVESMWYDIELRLGRLETTRSEQRKQSLKEFHGQFQASLIAYDEGFLSDDKVLAAAVWRSVFYLRPVDPRLLDDTVLYIRKQINHLDLTNEEDLLHRGYVTFLPLNSVFSVS